jgi:predicted nuclease of predicted toxin-antitoxin system
MRLYLDDDSVSGILVRLLVNAGHDVQVPADVGLSGADDPIHLTHTARDGRVLVSGNHDDFRNLHNLVVQTGGGHPGILIVRRDNDPRRDMSPRGIAHAIEKLLASNVPIANQFIILNQWR